MTASKGGGASNPSDDSLADKKRMSILWVKAGYLYSLNTGGLKRSHAMLERISREHHVTFLALVDDKIDANPEEQNGSYAHEKIFVPWTDSKKSRWRFLWEAVNNFLFSPLPLSLDRYRSEALNQAILDQCNTGQFDLVICDFLTPATAFVDIDLKENTPVVLFQHNVESDIWRHRSAIL